MENADAEWSREVKGSMYDIVVEGFQILSKWTGRVWDQCAWKFSRPCKDIPLPTQENAAPYVDYEKVFQFYSFVFSKFYCILFSFLGLICFSWCFKFLCPVIASVSEDHVAIC